MLLRFDFNIEKIKQEVIKRPDITESSNKKLFEIIDKSLSSFDILYESYQHKDYLYNFELKPILSSNIGNKKETPPKYQNAKNLSPEFYKGFGEDLYASI